MDATALARRLTRGQRSTLEGLSETPAVLGCSEPYAARLSVATPNRPALVTRHAAEPYAMFSLNSDGVAVKTAMEGLTL